MFQINVSPICIPESWLLKERGGKSLLWAHVYVSHTLCRFIYSEVFLSLRSPAVCKGETTLKKSLGPQGALEKRCNNVFIPVHAILVLPVTPFHLPSNQVIIALKCLLFVSQKVLSRSPFLVLQLNFGKKTYVGSVLLSLSYLVRLYHGQLQHLWTIPSLGGNHPYRQSLAENSFLILLIGTVV